MALATIESDLEGDNFRMLKDSSEVFADDEFIEDEELSSRQAHFKKGKKFKSKLNLKKSSVYNSNQAQIPKVSHTNPSMTLKI